MKQGNSFQKKLNELEKIQEKIQNHSDDNLDELITLYEQGLKLASTLEQELNKYEGRIQTIEDGELEKLSEDENISDNDETGIPSSDDTTEIAAQGTTSRNPKKESTQAGTSAPTPSPLFHEDPS